LIVGERGVTEAGLVRPRRARQRHVGLLEELPRRRDAVGAGLGEQQRMLEEEAEVRRALVARRVGGTPVAHVGIRLLSPDRDVASHGLPEGRVLQPLLQLWLVVADVPRLLADADHPDDAARAWRLRRTGLQGVEELLHVRARTGQIAPHTRVHLVERPRLAEREVVAAVAGALEELVRGVCRRLPVALPPALPAREA